MNKNREYELFVRSITQALVNAQGLESVTVQHDVLVQGKARHHQIDVYWEYRLGGILHRVLISCKNYTNTVEVGDLLEFNGVLSDIPGTRGVVVTTVGFQKGAVDIAKHYSIGLKVIRPPVDADYDGRIREIHINLRIASPRILGCDIKLDRPWMEANVADPDAYAGPGTRSTRTSAVRDLELGTVTPLSEIIDTMLDGSAAAREGEELSKTVSWSDARLESDGDLPLKIVEMTIRWRWEAPDAETMIVRAKDPSAIVKDALSGTLLFVDDDGRVTGDVATELGTGGKDRQN